MRRKLSLIAWILVFTGGLAALAGATAAGSVVTLTKDRIVIDNGSDPQTFVLTAETSIEKGVEKGAQVIVEFHQDDRGNAVADRVTVGARTRPAGPASTSPSIPTEWNRATIAPR